MDLILDVNIQIYPVDLGKIVLFFSRVVVVLIWCHPHDGISFAQVTSSDW